MLLLIRVSTNIVNWQLGTFSWKPEGRMRMKRREWADVSTNSWHRRSAQFNLIGKN